MERGIYRELGTVGKRTDIAVFCDSTGFVIVFVAVMLDAAFEIMQPRRGIDMR